MTSMFVLNEATCAYCGHPTRGRQCTCQTHNSQKPEPLGLPVWNFELEPQQDFSQPTAAQQQVHNGDDAPRFAGDAALGLPSWDDVYASAASPELVANLRGNVRGDDSQQADGSDRPTPLGLPTMKW